MTTPQPVPGPSFAPAGDRPAADRPAGPRPIPLQPPPRPLEGSVTYTVIAPAPPRPPLGAPPYRPSAAPPGARPVAPRHGATLVAPEVLRVLVAGLALVAVVLGVTLPGPAGSGWDVFAAWAAFAVAAALAVLAGGSIEQRSWSWPLQLYGTLGLLLFWLVAALPIAVSNVGFLLTAGVALAVLGSLRNPLRPPWRAMFGPVAARRS